MDNTFDVQRERKTTDSNEEVTEETNQENKTIQQTNNNVLDVLVDEGEIIKKLFD
jgi:hypothetical protein